MVVLLLLLMGGVFLWAGGRLVYLRHTLRRNGAKAWGLVVDVARRRDREGGTTYRPIVRWTTVDGRPAEAVASVGTGRLGRRFRPGRTVLVHYDRDWPDTMVIEGYATVAEWVFLLVGVGLLAGTVVLVVLGRLP